MFQVRFMSMLAHYLIEPEASHDLAILCSQYLNYNLNKKRESRNDCVSGLISSTTKEVASELEKRRHSKLMSDTEMPFRCWRHGV